MQPVYASSRAASLPVHVQQSRKAPAFEVSCQLQQARGVADGIMATVELMAASGLPCFGRGKPVENLRGRFRLDLTDAQVATVGGHSQFDTFLFR
jgi:hypothetical protein